ncbi:hypothetical protein VO64_3386 [Pseudomonas synxantha]|uniref:Mobile element protein n=1 Tax=Pseudomonas synxantha TaxID=47883 RepID=A0AAU8U082_9PSED|nr:hypothetical protein VO64_3386 [Pseudomonas synxantha]
MAVWFIQKRFHGVRQCPIRLLKEIGQIITINQLCPMQCVSPIK